MHAIYNYQKEFQINPQSVCANILTLNFLAKEHS